MSGTKITIGRFRGSSGPDLAQVGVNEQITSMSPASHASRLIIYEMGGWIGHWSGSAVARYGLFWTATHSSSPGGKRPGGLAARTVEISPTNNYNTGGGGSQKIARLEEPFLTDSNYVYAVGVASRNAQLGVAMYQASAINETNEQFYRTNISSTNLVDPGSGSAMSNEGQLAVWASGEANVAPNTPGVVTQSGSAIQPTMKSTFSDANELLGDGYNTPWDYIGSHQHRVSWGGQVRWGPTTYTATATERSGGYSQRQIGVVVPYDTTVTYEVRHSDRAGLWSGWRSYTFLVPNPNAAPSAPTIINPAGTETNGALKPSLQMKHIDSDGDSTAYVHMQVRRVSDNYVMLDKSWGVSVPNNGTASRTYDGTALKYYTAYEFRGRTHDGKLWGPWSAYKAFEIAHVNHAPSAPGSLTPASTVVGTRAMTLTSTFADSDMVLPDGTAWDWFDAYEITIKRRSDNVNVLNPTIYPTNSTEKSQKKSSRPYTVPAYGVDYYYVIRHRDRKGAWGSASARIIRAETGTGVSEPTSPSGVVTNLVNPGNIVAQYVNDTAGRNTSHVQAALRNSSGTVIDTSTEIAQTVAPGGTITISWTAAGFPALSPGLGYSVIVRAKDIAGNWSDWSDPQEFNANAAPSIAAHKNPVANFASATIPYFSITATDANHALSELSGLIRFLTDDETSELGRYTVNYDAATKTLRGLPPAGIITAYGTYKWQGMAYDGHLYSGGGETPGTGQWSASRTFIYAQVPEVTITGPASPISTTTPTITWSSTNQLFYQVVMTNSEDVVVYDTGKTSGATQLHTITNAFWQGGEAWNDGEAWNVTVSVWDASTLRGESAPHTLLLSYTPPTSLFTQAEAITMPGTSGTNAIRITHDQTNYAEGEFLAYITSRVAISGPGGLAIDGTFRSEYSRNATASDPTLLDAEVVSGQWYRYGVRQEIRQGNDVLYGQLTEVEAMAEWRGAILHLPYSPLNYVVHMEYSAPGSPYSEESAWEGAMGSIETMSGGAPIGVNPRGTWGTKSGEFGFVDDGQLTANERRDQLRRLWKTQFRNNSPDGRPHIVCWRDGRGGDDGIIFGQLDTPVIRHSRGGAYGVTLRLNERKFILGELLGYG